MADEPINVPRLALDSVMGFNGAVSSGLIAHPDRQHIIFPLGCTIIVEDISNHKQHFLWGHTNDVSCLAVSNSGKYLASGQVTHMGFKADVIIWDYEKMEMYCRLSLHKVKVEALAFSPNDQYLVSLGGQDDGCVVVWNIAKKEPICGHPAQVESAGITYCVSFSNVRDDLFVTGGDGTLRVWELDVDNRKIRPTDVTMGQLKRVVKCIQMADDEDLEEKFFFCGTTTGDIIAINMKTRLFQFLGPEKDKFTLGVTSLALIKSGEFIVGAGNGALAVAKFVIVHDKHKKPKATLKIKKQWKDDDQKGQSVAITSIALRGTGHQFFAGTANSQMYRFNFAEFKAELIKTCHSDTINDVVFPYGTSELIVTCQGQEIRIWQLKSKKEIRRHVVANMTCNAIDITRDGKTIVSAWDDGMIRAFGFVPKDTNLEKKFEIGDAHNKGVSAIACTSDGNRIISGGGEGQVRIWDISLGYDAKGKMVYMHKLVETMKEHKGSVSDIKIRKNDNECASASTDGTCIIWDLEKKVRKQIVFANTLFKCVLYGLHECQIITSGTDRKIGYWETFDGSAIRELEGAKSGSINAMDMSPDCDFFVTGGDDKLLKVWTYNEGEVTNVGIGHSGPITKVKICPNQKYIVSVSADGAVLVWKFPFEPFSQQQQCQ